VAIDVDSLEPPNASEVHMGFKQLVLPDDHKDILESQVREHFRKRGAQASHIAAEDDMDLVRGKGQGLIILLHGTSSPEIVTRRTAYSLALGAPGVGKTATAECIADLMAKPLYPITCGDLGSTAEEVEKNLKKHFTLASKWDCVMLLDEADVFLAKRKQADLMRNSIVSVFLRMLEYYKGLLFLTTNRVGTFDEAFKSRVHISLFCKLDHYRKTLNDTLILFADPNFDRDTTIRVWKTFIKQTRRALERNNRTGIRIDKEGILKFAKDHWKKHPDARWNGRQIRNAFHTAVAMAEFSARGGKLANGEYDQERDVKIDVGRAQFEKIANTVKEFDDYMREAIGMSYEAKAVKERMRARNLETSTKVRESSKKSKKKSQKKEDTEESSSEEIEEKVVRSKADAKKSRARVEDSDDDDDDDASSDED
jgi:hypothetical protein